jgi:hypothetical protein
MKMKIVNERGIEEIRQFLSENHKKGGDHFTRSMLKAWAADAEFQLDEGNPPIIELKSWDSVHGRTQTYTISDEGIDTITYVELNGYGHEITVVVGYMDDDIREELHDRMVGNCTEQEFLDAYVIAHKQKFGEEFLIN